MFDFILLLLFAYVCGSIPFGKIVACRRGVDIQKRGSGNIGFANVKRVLGWNAGLVTLSGDIAKGIVPTAIAMHYFTPVIAFTVGVAAIVGHVFCVWLKFRGGKGIATGLGVVAVLSPIAAVVGSIVYSILCTVRAQSSTASVMGALCTAGVAVALSPASWWQYVILLGIVAYTLRHNLWGTVPDYDK